MANLSRLFSVKIGRQTTAAQYGVFGVGIILAPGAAFFGLKYSTYESAKIENFNDLYRVYTSADDAASDGMSGDNLLAVQAYFSQSPSPDTLVVGDFSAAYSKTMIRLTGVPVAGAPAATKATIGYVKGSEYRYAKFNGTAWSGSTGATADIVADSGAEGQFLVDGRIVYLEGAEVVHKSSVVLSAAVSQAIAAIKNQYNKFFMSMTPSRDLSIQKAIADWTESQVDKMAVFIDDYSSPTWATDNITKYICEKILQVRLPYQPNGKRTSLMLLWLVAVWLCNRAQKHGRLRRLMPYKPMTLPKLITRKSRHSTVTRLRITVPASR